MALFTDSERRFFAPEVVQTSAMDCGPAALKCLLEGHGIPASYGRLREACQTDVDGTSVDTIEDIAVQLGLNASQVMVPADHLLLQESDVLPALVITRQPTGLTHFVVIWNIVGPLVQIMDPATGRRWVSRKRLLDEMFTHVQSVPADAWREWAGSPGFVDPLERRLLNLRLPADDVEMLLEFALGDEDWAGLAIVDAATRLVESLVRGGGIEAGTEASELLIRFVLRLDAEPEVAFDVVPETYWSVIPIDETWDTGLYLSFRGVVLISIQGRSEISAEATESSAQESPLSQDLVAALEEPPANPLREIFSLMREDGYLTPTMLAIAIALATFGVAIEALLLRGLLTVGEQLGLVSQRINFILGLFVFFAALLLLEFPIYSTIFRMGRRLETRLRVKVLDKIPRLGDRYFHSRLVSDMAYRAHGLRQIRSLPDTASSFLRILFQLVLTTAGVMIFAPRSAPIAFLAMLVSVGLALSSQPMIQERDMRFRTHSGAMGRFFLDGLLGLVPLRTHRAGRAFRREHEMLLNEWMKSGNDFFQVQQLFQGVEGLAGALFAIWILFNYVNQGGEASGVLLIFYWTLNIPQLGQSLASYAEYYPILRNQLTRIVEPLTAPEEDDSRVKSSDDEEVPVSRPIEAREEGVEIEIENATIQAGGHTILTDIWLHIKPGEHVGVVGSSGAGKSSLAGLFLGWHRAATGRVLVDGEELWGERLRSLRRHMAWIDPSVHVWNRSLLDNLRYGHAASGTAPISQVVENANLFGVLQRLPEGLQTNLGEGGGLVSGGEGQRVRLGRAMMQDQVRLVILDEPFRGLDRPQRTELLNRVREQWKDATLIFISHDVADTLAFDRVVVVHAGQIVEDDNPADLAERENSRYAQLLEAERIVREDVWTSENWRRLWLQQGQLQERDQVDAHLEGYEKSEHDTGDFEVPDEFEDDGDSE